MWLEKDPKSNTSGKENRFLISFLNYFSFHSWAGCLGSYFKLSKAFLKSWLKCALNLLLSVTLSKAYFEQFLVFKLYLFSHKGMLQICLLEDWKQRTEISHRIEISLQHRESTVDELWPGRFHLWCLIKAVGNQESSLCCSIYYLDKR